jgi:hypothetical protein
MIQKLGKLLFGDDAQHPIELPSDEHRQKQIELREKQKRLRSEKQQLQDQLDAKKQEYFDARDAGDNKRAEELKRDAEDIRSDLQTVQGKLDTVDQMLTTVGNFLNVYELRELGEDEYWEQLRALDRDELIEVFSEEKMDMEDLIGRVDVAATAGEDVIENVSEQAEQLHSSSNLNWEEEYERQQQSTREEDPFAVSEDTSGLNDDDLDDLQLS